MYTTDGREDETVGGHDSKLGFGMTRVWGVHSHIMPGLTVPLGYPRGRICWSGPQKACVASADLPAPRPFRTPWRASCAWETACRADHLSTVPNVPRREMAGPARRVVGMIRTGGSCGSWCSTRNPCAGHAEGKHRNTLTTSSRWRRVGPTTDRTCRVCVSGVTRSRRPGSMVHLGGERWTNWRTGSSDR